MPDSARSPAVDAFDAVAERFDERFGEWRSVAAQRAAVRRYLLEVFPLGSHLLELAGGTAEDALFLAARDRQILLTDGAPAMIARARAKIEASGLAHRIDTRELLFEDLQSFAASTAAPPLDGAYSNFAGLNCVTDLRPVARGLAMLLPEGASAVLVVFGPMPPGEVLVQLLRGDVGAAFRRLRTHRAPARLGGHDFEVSYPSPDEVAQSFAPYFRLHGKRGIGVFVPPSAAEPFVSSMPRLLHALERADELAAAPLALLGDHVLLHFVRTPTPAPEQRT